MAKYKIDTYKFNPGVSITANKVPNAYFLIEQNKTFIEDEAVAWISDRVVSDTALNLYPNAVDLLENNIQFIKKEALAYIANETAGAVEGSPWFNYTYNSLKCERDIGYNITALVKDLKYGGNERSRYVQSLYWQDDNPQIDGDRLAEIDVYVWMQDLLENYILKNIGYISLQVTAVQYVSSNNAETSAVNKVVTTLTNLRSVIQNGLSSLPTLSYGATFSEYTYNATKCKRDIKYVLDAYLDDIRYGGNSKTWDTVSKYWNEGVPQVDGSRKPEIETHAFIRDLINQNILTNVAHTSLQSPVTSTQIINTNYTAESTVASQIVTLYNLLADVVENGLDVRPEKVSGLGYIRVQGRVREDDLLIITNVTRGEVLFTFNDPNKLAVCNFLKDYEGADNDFPSFTQVTDTITSIQLYADTSGHSSTDRLQIFKEEKEVRTRPYDFGTDAIERNRVASAQSMLDADFEYGLQPTKWQAIGMLRGYPSIYEISGTEIAVDTVETDASTTTEGIGQSIITVTCAGPHNFNPGQPFTIKGLGGTAIGIGRAEGSFIVYTTPTNNKFTFFAKSKVGTSAGEILSTTYTQLRKAGFYTGAPIGSPSFEVTSQGSSGTFIVNLDVPSESDTVPFIGTVPELGAPLVDSSGAIPLGSQVTATNGPGGVVTTADLTQDVPADSLSFDVLDTSGIVVGQAIDSGDGTASFVTEVSGQTVILSNALTADRVGSNVTYTNLIAAIVGGSAGTGATFNVTRSAGNYSATLVNVGADYNINDVLLITGNNIGGLQGTNDLAIRVTTVNAFGSITGITTSGVAAPADGSFSNTSGNLQGGSGDGAKFDISVLNNVYTVTLAAVSFTDVGSFTPNLLGFGADLSVSYQNNTYNTAINAPGTGYSAGQRLIVTGDQFGGTSPTNDLTVTIVSVDGSGSILNVSPTGVAPDASEIFSNSPITYNGVNGINAQFILRKTGATYSVEQIQNPGSGYLVNETFTVLGTDLGGTSPTNDLTITVTTIDAGGEITGTSVTGTANNSFPAASYTPNYTAGQGATFDVAKSGASYNVTLNNAGSNYAIGDSVIVTLVPLGYSGNDIELSITDVDATGAILTFSIISGVSPTTGGTGYFPNDTITILGTIINNGQTPTHDLTITVSTVNASGTILTFTRSGTAPDARVDYQNVPWTTAGNGVNAIIDVNVLGTVYTPSVLNAGSAFNIGDQLVISGADLNGSTPGNDLILTVSDVDGSGGILAVNKSGTARNSFSQLNLSGQIKAGTGATFNITNTSTVYDAVLSSPGQDYTLNQQIIIPGNQIGGVTPNNDLTITITGVGTTGDITAISFSGTGGDGTGNYTGIAADYAPNTGGGAVFNIQRSGATYNVTTTSAGSGYYVGNTLVVSGSLLGGTNGVNDVTIVVASIGSNGDIVTVSSSGTPTSSSAIQFFSTITFSEITVNSISAGTEIVYRALATIGVTFNSNHGLVPGDTFIVTISSDDGIGNNHALASGAYIVTKVPSLSQLEYQARAAGTIDDAVDTVEGTLYARPDSFFVHRPYDGGVQLGTGGPQHGAQAIRQSKNYIRYQSGKGIMYTTGALFAPSYDLLSGLADGTAIGNSITFETDDVDHGLQVGGTIEILGVETPGYNGIYKVSDIVSERKFKVVASTTLGSTLPRLGTAAQVSTKGWHGATVRAGAFDEQNGIFWQYDGVNLAVVQRSSTFQLSGLATITPEDNTLYGTNCRFLDQCAAGDRIVIRGMTHVISNVIDNNTMTVTPDYRGVRKAESAKVCLINDKIVKQPNFNLDPLDGTGDSGYDLDISKMQMIGIQYSWYGAGFIDYMLRGSDGNFVFCHRMRNSNVNTEAFMRSGNLPVRYEVTNEGANGKLANNITDSQTSIELLDASFFPTTGATLYIDNEIITYTGISGNILTGCTRGASLINYQAGAQRQYTAGLPSAHSARTGVVIISSTITPIISHWGSAFITDGGFDSDRGYIFAYAATSVLISTARNTAFLIRLAPSVSNAITGDLGDRELLNRAQLLLNGIEVTSDPLSDGDSGGIVVEGILNPSNYPTAVNDVTWGGLNRLADGGQPSFAQIAPGAGINWDVGPATTTDLATVAANIAVPIDIIVGRAGSNWFYTRAVQEYQLAEGAELSGTDSSARNIFSNGTVITGVQRNFATTYDGSANVLVDRWTTSRGLDRSINWWQSGSTPTNAAATLIAPTSGGNLTLLFPQTTFLASGVSTGTAIATTEADFPTSTSVSKIVALTHGTTTVSAVTFNNPTGITFVAGATITFDLSGAAYAQPGETIFKFIAVPGERSELDLNPIKELTNTSLGGRGTFPNGPDVLAINIYKTNGSEIVGNVILKWGEAQA
jgi:hypothetical protein